MRVWHKIGLTLHMIKWEHSIFALPFALTAAMLAASGWPRPNQIFWIIVCMVFMPARTRSMTAAKA
jgi:4-hydroxybenzoate polyprenyltransferase